MSKRLNFVVDMDGEHVSFEEMKSFSKPMTVKSLISKLSKLFPNNIVYIKSIFMKKSNNK